MTKLVINSVLQCIVILFFVGTTSLSYAASNTNSDSNPGQVKVNSNGDTVYLSTTINKAGATETITENSATKSDSNVSNNAADTNNLDRSSEVTGFIAQPLGFVDNLGDYISSLLTLIMMISLLLVFFNFILAGFRWITSGGDRGKTEEARNTIVNAFVGILIVASSFAVASFVAYILGFESINDAVGSIRQINPS